MTVSGAWPRSEGCEWLLTGELAFTVATFGSLAGAIALRLAAGHT
jgi:hypothetical protein